MKEKNDVLTLYSMEVKTDNPAWPDHCRVAAYSLSEALGLAALRLKVSKDQILSCNKLCTIDYVIGIE